MTTSAAFDKLFEVMERDKTDEQPIVRLNAPSSRESQKDFIHSGRDKYTSSELIALKQRDFQTRLFISSMSLDNCVWLRTHHSDNAERMTNFTYIRDYYKAACATNNHSAAKSTMTALLTAMFAKEESNYNSFATVVASGLSSEAKHTSFEIKDDMVSKKSDLDIARRNLIILMDVVFPKVSMRRYLLDQKNCNIFRLVHCDIRGRSNNNKWPIIYCIFSFFLQACMTTFVVFQVYETDRLGQDTDKAPLLKYGLWVLASLGSLYSALLAVPEITQAIKSLQFYGFIGIIPIIDLFVNIAIPIILVPCGFIVIVQENEGFINAVLNTAALLFIPEIDDRLPALLGYDEKAIVENFLIKEANREYNRYTKMSDNDIKERFKGKKLGVEFNDFFITNSVERGRSHQDFALYQPFNVKSNKVGHEIDPSNYITGDCLLSKIEWRYTHWGKDDTTKPRIGYLKLYKLSGEVVEIEYKGKEKLELQDQLYSIPDGVYIMTSFVFSSSILKLRLCGSRTAEHFKTAMEYYSLWELTFKAENMLKQHTNKYGGGGHVNNDDVFRVSPHDLTPAGQKDGEAAGFVDRGIA